MKIVEPSFKIETELDYDKILAEIESTARVCYKSEERSNPETREKFVGKLIDSKHESVLEHVSIRVRFICDRAIANELVRHRLASYSQSSTRYIKLDNNMEFILPVGINEQQTDLIKATYNTLKKMYLYLLSVGTKPELARSILPLGLKTEIVMTANIREWRHILKLRTDKKAHPSMRQLMIPLLEELKNKLPIFFRDV